MTQVETADRSGAPSSSFSNSVAPAAIIVGGLLMAALYVPFTAAHGPTSYNEEREILGWDMHVWGLLLGTVPGLCVLSGVWVLRRRIAGTRRGARVAVAVVCFSLLADVAMNLAFRALGPPFVLFPLAVATIAVAALGAAGRLVFAALGIVCVAGVALSLIPEETSDSLAGFRIYGIVVHVIGGGLWVVLGLLMLLRRRA